MKGQTMLDMIDKLASDTPAKFTEDQAREYLARLTAQGHKRPSVRALADQWGWSKSTVGRFVDECDGTTRDNAGTEAPTREQLANLLRNALAEFDEKIGAPDRERRDDDRLIDAIVAARFQENSGTAFGDDIPERAADKPGTICLMPAQMEVNIRHADGGWYLTQEDPFDTEEDVIFIPDSAMMDFVDRLTDVIGIPSMGKP